MSPWVEEVLKRAISRDDDRFVITFVGAVAAQALKQDDTEAWLLAVADNTHPGMRRLSPGVRQAYCVIARKLVDDCCRKAISPRYCP